MEDISSTTILQNIRVLRQERKYSQEYMAFRLTFSQNAYSKLERGLTRLTLERLAQIAEILGTTLSELIKEPAEEKAPDE
ncbi:helix-turn-helix protein [Anseongella ginsenosidimutans]|uniref:Helix-turn-helix protein n=1 Tax=Anseongella ginsenosidimutans TaxID=496056 RepID=A0A4R3KNN6_9SPHI|nr:helix-turn-helix transcriptional regulator [Anseongella ginsenosidimutans]QEC52054.1 helix-turn-helix transcriptional regulator [Anseongella ginsenosidimutans]TCS85637.1 helix-turn-helix protein [Anseongella ginsenosidimutans]